MSKICNKCGLKLEDDYNFCPNCKSQSFRSANEVTEVKNSNRIYSLLYWNYGGRYRLSKTKLTSICVFLTIILSGIGSDVFAAFVLIAVLFALITFLFGYVCHKLVSHPSRNELDGDDSGLVIDLLHLLFFWQNRQTGEFVFSKTKIISHIIFILAGIAGMSYPNGTLILFILFGLIFEVPAFVIGSAIHKLTNKNPVRPVKIQTKTPPRQEIKKTPQKPVVLDSEFKDYEIRFSQLKEKYNKKDTKARELIEKRFTPPQLTYTKFINVVDNSLALFNNQYESAINIMDLASEYSPKIAHELDSKIDILNSLISKLDDLANELVLSIDHSQGDASQLISEMEDLIHSVKNYE